MAKKAFTIVLDADVFKKLQDIAAREIRPVAQLARVIIERYVKRNEEK
jgi:predicted transcriptional regulator